MTLLLSLAGTILFLLGVWSFVQLRQLAKQEKIAPNDPFGNYLAVLFWTGERTLDFRRRQRRTIWLFCGAALLLYIARAGI